MRVFHFATKEHAISDIKNSWLKVATINELNDPFEFYANFTSCGEPLDESTLNRVKGHYNKKMGFLCFSRHWNNPVQWAHYANKHKGLCLEFVIPDKLLLKLNYHLLKVGGLAQLGCRLLKSSTRTKLNAHESMHLKSRSPSKDGGFYQIYGNKISKEANSYR